MPDNHLLFADICLINTLFYTSTTKNAKISRPYRYRDPIESRDLQLSESFYNTLCLSLPYLLLQKKQEIPVILLEY